MYLPAKRCLDGGRGKSGKVYAKSCSKDRSLDIALACAKRDSRVRVHNNEKFVGVIENHNIAFSLISPAAKYCKVVSADDIIFPESIRRLVEVGEMHPSAGIIGSYQQSGKYVKWQGFPYPRAVMPGRDICRRRSSSRARSPRGLTTRKISVPAASWVFNAFETKIT